MSIGWSVISFGMSFLLFLSTIVFDIVVVDFDLSLSVGDKFFYSDDNGTINQLSGLDRIFR